MISLISHNIKQCLFPSQLAIEKENIDPQVFLLSQVHDETMQVISHTIPTCTKEKCTTGAHVDSP